MSGHSKWSTIKRKKSASDQKRGKIFTKIIKEIMIAARMGGGDEDSNPRLRTAILAAKAVNMPGDNIKRAILKGTGELPGQQLEEGTFEGFGPGGAAIMLEVLTDNRKRTVAEIRHRMHKYGGNLGENGSVSWMFDRKGIITINRKDIVEDKLFEAALEAGAEDFNNEDEEVFVITTDPARMNAVREVLEAQEYVVESSELEMVPRNVQKIEGSDADKLLKLLDELEDHDDVKNVFSNFDIDEHLVPSE